MVPVQIANSWRTNDDISLGIEASWRGIMDNLGATVGLSQFAGPGGWNDAGQNLDFYNPVVYKRGEGMLCCAHHAIPCARSSSTHIVPPSVFSILEL